MCSTGYFDLQVTGGDGGYSMADYLAARGFIIVALDHIGAGESSAVHDTFVLTPHVVSTINHGAHCEVFHRLEAGTLVRGLGPLPPFVRVGLGHSMGGMLAAVQQGLHRTFDAVVNLGHGGDGLPDLLTDDELAVVGDHNAYASRIIDLARRRFDANEQRNGPRRSSGRPRAFHAPDVPDAVRTAFQEQQTNLLHACGLTSMIPHATDGEKARIEVPVFLGFGEQDLTEHPHAAVLQYGSSPDVALFVLPGSRHCHNQSSQRVMLWNRLAVWLRNETVGLSGARGA
jgi:alpha-beta hydrolase superfamily lysophospholipase